MPTSYLVSILIIALILWRLYARVRRMIGRQLMRKGHVQATVVLWPVLVVVIGLSMHGDPQALGSLAAGIVAGGALAIVGLRLTRFQPTADGFYYVPNAHIGVALSLLFVGRILFRVFQIYSSAEQPHAQPPLVNPGPLTIMLFALLAGYYFSFALGLIRKHAELAIPPAAQPAKSGDAP